MIDIIVQMIQVTALNLGLSVLVVLSAATIPDLTDYFLYRLSPFTWIQRLGFKVYLRKRVQSILPIVLTALIITNVLRIYFGSWLTYRIGIMVSLGIVFCGMYGYQRWRCPQGESHPGAVLDEIAPKHAGVQYLEKALLSVSRETLFFATLPVSVKAEAQHFKLIGLSGVGKSTVIKTMMHAAVLRGDRVLIVDPDGEYLSSFYQPKRGDIILNPCDARSHGWLVLDDIQSIQEAYEFVDHLISKEVGEGAWHEQTRTYVASLLMYAKQKKKSFSDFWHVALENSVAELAGVLQTTAAASYTEESNVAMLSSIRDQARTWLTPLEYLRYGAGPNISLRDWVKTGKGCLFLSYQTNQDKSMHSLISLWVQWVAEKTMRLEERDHRLWFFINELESIGRMDGMKDLLSRIGRYGGRVVLGVQSIAKLQAIYGDDTTPILEQCLNALILKCAVRENGASTSAFASQQIEEHERTMVKVSFDLQTKQRQHEVITLAQAVRPMDIEQLPDRHGYVKLSDVAHWFKVSFVAYDVPKLVPAFELRQTGE